MTQRQQMASRKYQLSYMSMKDNRSWFQLHNDIAQPSKAQGRSPVAAFHRHFRRMMLDTKNSDKTITPVSNFMNLLPQEARNPSVFLYDYNRFNFEDIDPTHRLFYHASWVDGFKFERYLLATAPHTKTTQAQFWEMVFEVKPIAVVVMMTKQRTFIPAVGKQIRLFEYPLCLDLHNYEKIDEARDRSFTKYAVRLYRNVGERFETTFYQMMEDISPVPSYFPMLRLELSQIRRKTKPKKGFVPTTSTLLLASEDGVTKNGNFCVFDIVMNKAVAIGEVGLNETVKDLRRQRYGTVDTQDQYARLDALLRTQIELLVQAAEAMQN